MEFHFFMDMIPPRTTAQQSKWTARNGKVVNYKPDRVKSAQESLEWHLARYRQPTMQGPVRLHVVWCFPITKGSGHKDGEYKLTRPDTDNLNKMLKDCMTRLGFWKDDAQVVDERIEKIWAKRPGIEIFAEEVGRNK